jgi:hypothetical protein
MLNTELLTYVLNGCTIGSFIVRFYIFIFFLKKKNYIFINTNRCENKKKKSFKIPSDLLVIDLLL